MEFGNSRNDKPNSLRICKKWSQVDFEKVEAENKSVEEIRKKVRAKNKKLEGSIVKVTKDFLTILVQEHFRLSRLGSLILITEPYEIKYEVEETYPYKSDLKVGTKVTVNVGAVFENLEYESVKNDKPRNLRIVGNFSSADFEKVKIKNKRIEGSIVKVTKEYVTILVQEYYRLSKVGQGKLKHFLICILPTYSNEPSNFGVLKENLCYTI